MTGFTARIAIIGAGRRGMLILAALYGEKGIIIAGIADKDPDAPGFHVAEDLGIYHTTDADELLSKNVFDFVVNATNSREVSEKLEGYRDRFSVIDGKNAGFFITLLEEQKRDKDELKRQSEKIGELNDTLEKKVVERTKELENANMELERINKLKSQFIANMSHELRTPLNSIIGFSEVILEGYFGEINEKHRKYVRNIHTSGKHLQHLINNILDLAKAESGKISLEPEEFSLEEAINEVLTIVNSLASKKKVKLSFDLDLRIETIAADRVKLKQILYNLLSNAIKFTPEGGNVSLKAEVLGAEDKIGKDILKVMIKDTGIGIRQEDRDRIWNEFEQADGTLSRKYEGTGLGLALTKRFVESHGGIIWVESEVDKGSKFIFTMPRYTEPVQKVYEEKVVETAALDQKRFQWQQSDTVMRKVLIVEDDPKTSELLTLQLISDGYQVYHSFDGEDAIRRAKEINPFAIILDIMLPRKDGWEVLQDLKLFPETKDIPVIVSSVVENKELGFALGAADYLIKPVDRKMLLGKLEEVCLPRRRHKMAARILVADDNPDAVELISSFLEPEGYAVIKAYSGKEAIDKAINLKPDIMLLDLMMPEMDGFEVIERLKFSPETESMPIFIITAKELTSEDRLRLTNYIERVFQKGSFVKDDILKQLRDLQIMHPKKAGLIDAVSGLFDHTYFRLRFTQELERAERYKYGSSLLIMAIDDFSTYIENNGEYHAHALIKKIGDLLSKYLRSSDILTRYSYDEFAIHLSYTVKDSANQVASRLKEVIANYPFYNAETQPGGRVTVSVGVAAFPLDGKTPEEFIDYAIRALKNAKASGGNVVSGRIM